MSLSSKLIVPIFDNSLVGNFRGWQRKIWMENVREDLKEKNIDSMRIGEATRNREVWSSLVRAPSSAH